MQNYPSDKLRNLCVVAHSGTGKTSLADAVAWLTKANDRFGKVDDGSSCLDTSADEVENKKTISAKLLPDIHPSSIKLAAEMKLTLWIWFVPVTLLTVYTSYKDVFAD